MAHDNDNEPMSRLKDVSQDLFKAFGEKAMSTVGERVSGLTDRLEGIADGGPVGKAVGKGGEAAAKGDSPVMGALKGAASGIKDKVTGGGGGSGGGSKATKSTNIVESIDVGVPLKVAYNQWTEYGSFPTFMKKVEGAEAADDTKINWKAQIFLSHREWEATVLEQVPDERIVWRSKGKKGHVDGAVTFHELGPNLTRILVVLEYYPQGLFEKTGNIWEAQGRRARAEIRHFRRHVMTRTILHPDDVEGWRGEIRDSKVVKSHEDALEEEEQEQQDQDGYEDSDEAEDEYEESDDSEGDPEAEDEYEESDEAEDEDEDEDEAEDEDEDADAEDDPEAEDEYEESDEAEDEDEGSDDAEEEPEAEEDEYEESDEAEEEPEAEEEEYEESDEAEDEPEPEAEEEEYEEEPEAEDEYEDDSEAGDDAEAEGEEDADEEARPARRKRRRSS